MTLPILNSTQYKIEEVIIVTKSGKINISGIFTEINIFWNALEHFYETNLGGGNLTILNSNQDWPQIYMRRWNAEMRDWVYGYEDKSIVDIVLNARDRYYRVNM